MIFSEAKLFVDRATFMFVPRASSYDRILGAIKADIFWSMRDLDTVVQWNIR